MSEAVGAYIRTYCKMYARYEEQYNRAIEGGWTSERAHHVAARVASGGPASPEMSDWFKNVHESRELRVLVGEMAGMPRVFRPSTPTAGHPDFGGVSPRIDALHETARQVEIYDRLVASLNAAGVAGLPIVATGYALHPHSPEKQLPIVEIAGTYGTIGATLKPGRAPQVAKESKRARAMEAMEAPRRQQPHEAPSRVPLTEPFPERKPTSPPPGKSDTRPPDDENGSKNKDTGGGATPESQASSTTAAPEDDLVERAIEAVRDPIGLAADSVKKSYEAVKQYKSYDTIYEDAIKEGLSPEGAHHKASASLPPGLASKFKSIHDSPEARQAALATYSAGHAILEPGSAPTTSPASRQESGSEIDMALQEMSDAGGGVPPLSAGQSGHSTATAAENGGETYSSDDGAPDYGVEDEADGPYPPPTWQGP